MNFAFFPRLSSRNTLILPLSCSNPCPSPNPLPATDSRAGSDRRGWVARRHWVVARRRSARRARDSVHGVPSPCGCSIYCSCGSSPCRRTRGSSSREESREGRSKHRCNLPSRCIKQEEIKRLQYFKYAFCRVNANAEGKDPAMRRTAH